MTTVKTRIIKIGNSHGIRIPKLVLDHIGLHDEVELEVHDNQLIVRPILHPRADWEASFQAMAVMGDDTLLDAASPSLSRWDEDEWAW